VDRHGPERLVAAIDVRDGMAIGSGWVAGAAGRPLGDVLLALRAAGVQLFAVTAIARDGLLEGPDLGLLDQVSALVGASRVIASAGVGSADDVRRLAARGFCGAILGRALYEGRLALRDAAIAASGGN
jgi:phosphoribosylformimino-5-aminoimidazole carboxamide ribotide isomerase